MLKENKQCLMLESQEIDNTSLSSAELNDLLTIQHTIFTMLAERGKTIDLLNKLCSLGEALLPGAVASIMYKDVSTGLISVLAAPSIPKTGHDALANLQPGPAGGSCGNAVFNNSPQFVYNTFEDERWKNLKQLAIDFNLCSCWSMPIKDSQGLAVGSFALSSFEHRAPNPFHKKILETCSSIVTVVLKSQALEHRNTLFSSSMKNSNAPMFITNKENKVEEVNEAFTQLFGYTSVELIGYNPKIIASKKQKKTFYQTMWKQLNSGSSWSGELINKTKEGNEITLWLNISPLYDENHQIQNYLAVYTDLTQLKKSKEELQFLAYNDRLTDLANKANLEKTLRSYNLKSSQSNNCCLILLNIDNFSYINTAYGFEQGDKLLKETAHLLRNFIPKNRVYHINSDEFALLYEGRVDYKNEIEKIKQYFQKHEINIAGIALNISFSFGVSKEKSNLLRSASIALKQAKTEGKNRHHLFDANEDSMEHYHRELFLNKNKILQKALNEDMIEPFFQGIRDNKKMHIKKFEALARINDNGHIITPYQFIDVAKLSGRLSEITRVMIDKSFAVMAKYDYTFSINISEEDLNDQYLCDYLKQKTEQYGIEPQRVILEILEGVSATNQQHNLDQLKELKSAGYKLAIDDFGAEYSNFGRTLDLDIDFLKIDAKYIRDIDTDKKSYEIVKAISYFAKNVNIEIVAEFVHNKAVQKVIDELEIDYSQGYYFSEPNPKPIEL